MVPFFGGQTPLLAPVVMAQIVTKTEHGCNKKMEQNFVLDSREKVGMTQKQFAEALGVTRSYLAKIECGVCPLSKKIKRRIDEVCSIHRAVTFSNPTTVHVAQDGSRIGTQTINAGANVRVGSPVPVPAPAPATESVLIKALRHQIATLEATVASQQKVIDSLTALLKPPSPHTSPRAPTPARPPVPSSPPLKPGRTSSTKTSQSSKPCSKNSPKNEHAAKRQRNGEADHHHD